MNYQIQKQTGSLILSLSIIFFLVSLTLAGYIFYRHWIIAYSASHQSTVTTTTSPDNDPLNPEITIDPVLSDQSDTIHTNIIEPMRQYFATRTQHLKSISITNSSESLFQVTITLTDKENVNSISFESDGSQWTPTLLEDSPPEASP